MNRTVTKNGKTVHLCTFKYTGPDGHVEQCHSPDSCPVCHQCSRLDGEKERGHCPGHLGLFPDVPVPGSDAHTKLQKQKRG